VELEHFYHAKLIEHGHPVADIQLAAHSPRITPNDWARIRTLTKIEPFGDERTIAGEESTAIGLFDGGESGYILVQAQRSPIRDRGVFLPSYHYVILPPPLIVDCGIDWVGWIKLIFGTLPHPTFPQRTTIPPIKIDVRPMADPAIYLNDLQRLTGSTAPTLMQAIADSGALYVIGAPTDLGSRLRFVQGLLTFFPAAEPPTFVTHYDSVARPDVKIYFSATGEGSPVYEWGKSSTFKMLRGGYAAWVYEQMKQPAMIVHVQNAIGTVTRPVFATADRRRAYDLTAAFSRVMQASESRQTPNVDDLWFIIENAPLPPAQRSNFAGMLNQVMDKRDPNNMIRWYFANNQPDRVGMTLASSPTLLDGVFKRLANQPKAALDVVLGFMGANPTPAAAEDMYLKAFDLLSGETQKTLLASLLPNFKGLSLAVQLRVIRVLAEQKRMDTIKDLLPALQQPRQNETAKDVARAAQYCATALDGFNGLRDTIQTVWLAKLRNFTPDEIHALIAPLRSRPELTLEARTFETACFFVEWMGSNPADTLSILEQLSDPGVYLSQLNDYLGGLTKPAQMLTEQFNQVSKNWLSHERETLANACAEIADLITTDFYLKETSDLASFAVAPASMVNWLSQTAKSVMPANVNPLPPVDRFFSETWPADLPLVLEVLKAIKDSLMGLRISSVDSRMARVELLGRVEAAGPGEQIGLVLYYVHRLGETLVAANARPTRKPNEIKQLSEGKGEKLFTTRAELVDILRWTAGKLRLTK
jgi:hypothetical protein